MTTDLATQQYVLVLRDGTLIHLSRQEAQTVRSNIENVGSVEMSFMIGESLIMKNAVSHLMLMTDYEDTLRRKRGQWKCKLDHWHERNESSCKDVDKQEEEMVTIEGSNERVHIQELLKDQKKPKEERIYVRDEKAGKWRRRDAVTNDNEDGDGQDKA